MNKYLRWHDQIIERAKSRKLDCYAEVHHIRPRSLGGNNDPSNLVELTYREHFLIHWLLTKILVGRERRAMVHALFTMSCSHPSGQRIVASWQYDVVRRLMKRGWRQKSSRVGEVITAILAKRHMSQTSLALHLGTSVQYLNGWITGRKSLSLKWANRVVDVMQLSVIERACLHRAGAKDEGFEINMSHDVETVTAQYNRQIEVNHV